VKRLLVVALLLGACRNAGVTVIPDSELPQDVFGSPTPSQPGAVPESGTIYLLRDGRLQPFVASLPRVATMPEALVAALVAAEPAGGLKTAVPLNTQLIDVGVSSGGTAVIDLTGEFERSAPGRVLALRVAQVVFTVTEAPGVSEVLLAIEGSGAAVLTGSEQLVDRPVTRNDYLSFAPPE